jgi:hypothetical protein
VWLLEPVEGRIILHQMLRELLGEVVLLFRQILDLLDVPFLR